MGARGGWRAVEMRQPARGGLVCRFMVGQVQWASWIFSLSQILISDW